MAVSSPGVQQTSVMVVGKDSAVLAALTKLLSLDPGISVVATAPSIATGTVSEMTPDVVLLDGSESAGDAGNVRSYLARVSPRSRLFPLSMLGEMTLSQLIDAIKTVSAHATGPHSAEKQPSRPSAREALSSLSERELQVVRLVAEGLSNKEISSRLSLSDKTVKNHISHILAKTGLTARTQVAVYAIRAGLV